MSDHNGDNMFSLREFCITLYFIEQYREGHPILPVIHASIQIDKAQKSGAKVQTTTQNSVTISGIPWRHNPGIFNLLQFSENIYMVQTSKSSFISSYTLVL